MHVLHYLLADFVTIWLQPFLQCRTLGHVLSGLGLTIKRRIWTVIDAAVLANPDFHRRLTLARISRLSLWPFGLGLFDLPRIGLNRSFRLFSFFSSGTHRAGWR